MIKEIVFATNNKNKLAELQQIVGNKFKIIGLQELNCTVELSETGLTLEANALEKAEYIYKNYKKNCFADDTGLEIESLNGKPGVFSARYAGDNKDMNENMNKVLSELKNKQNRQAQFRTVISLIINNKEYQFEGIVKGKITTKKHGNSGFGYDPIFMPEGYNKTFAEMTSEEKNKISHRGEAVKNLVDFLNTL